MQIRSLIALILCLVLSLSAPISVLSAGVKDSDSLSLSAKSAILIDVEEKNILYAKNERLRLPMASTTKIMTAIVALDLLPFDAMLSIPAEAVGVEGSSIYLREGELLTVGDLLKALLLESANDAAVALAVCSAGSVDAFAKICNETAKTLLLKDSNFTNPHGLFAENHYTTAYDLAIISAHALKDPRIREITATKSATIPLGITQANPFGEGVRHLKNHNKMLSTYEGAIGVKTGYTKKSGRCLVSAATRNSLTLIAVTLNAPDDWRDHQKMLDFGFENFEYATLFDEGEYEHAFPVSNSELQSVIATNVSPLRALLPKNTKISDIRIESHFRFAIAPIEKNQILGELVVYVGKKVRRSTLVSTQNIASKDENNGFFDFLFN